MNTTLFAVGVLFFILPAFIARAAHFTTASYKFSRLNRAEAFLPFFTNEWQIILVYALAYSALFHFTYWRLLAWFLPATWPAGKELLLSIITRIMNEGPQASAIAAGLCISTYHFVPFYFGLLLFSYSIGKITGLIRWNIIELYRQTVPNPWFYIIRPVGDDKITVIDVLTNVSRPNGYPILYRGIATAIINGRDGKPLAIAISQVYRLEPKPRRSLLGENDFKPIAIPGERLVILIDEIQNINVAQVIDVEPETCFDKFLRAVKAEFESSNLLGSLINLL